METGGTCVPPVGPFLVAAAAGNPARASVDAAPLLEARRAIHRLLGARLERHAGDPAAARANRVEHLAWAARRAALAETSAGGVRAALALGPACSAAVRAAGWLAEAPACVEVLLASSKSKTLAAIAASQSNVTRHLVDGSLGTNQPE